MPHRFTLGVVFGAPIELEASKSSTSNGDTSNGQHHTPSGHATPTQEEVSSHTYYSDNLPISCMPVQIDALHAKYVAAVTELWHAHKARFGYAASEKLVIK